MGGARAAQSGPGGIKFVAVGRASDKALVCHYGKSGAALEKEFLSMTEKVLCAPSWNEQVSLNSRHTLECDPNKFHFAVDGEQRVFILIADSMYPVRLTFELLEELRGEILREFAMKSMMCDEGALNGAMRPTMKELIEKYSDPASVDKIFSVQAKVDEVRDVMNDNINTVLANTEKIEHVQQKTSQLNAQAQVFKATGSKIKRSMWCQNLKLALGIGLLCILLLIVILLGAGAFSSD